MYPRNASMPPRIAVGAVIQISDGAVQSSGVSVSVRGEGGYESPGTGTISYGMNSSVVYYAPTQGETNYTAFVVTAYKTGCIPVSVTIVTSANSTAGVANANMIEVSGDSAAADNLETMLDGTGGQTLSLGKLKLYGSDAGGVLDIDATGSNPAVQIDTMGSGAGVSINSSSGPGLYISASDGMYGAVYINNSSGYGIQVIGSTHGIYTTGNSGRGLFAQGSEGGIMAYAYTAGPGLECYDASFGEDIKLTGSQSVKDAMGNVLLDSTIAGRIDVAVSSRNATAPDNASITAIKVVTDALVDPATIAAAVEAAILDEGDATPLLAAISAKVEEFLINEGDASATLAAIATAVWSYATRVLTANTNLNDLDAAAIRAALGLAAADLDAQLNALPTAAENSSQLQADLATEIGRIDAAISSRNATAPDNATIASIDGKVDTISTNVSTLLSRITATLFNGVTSLAQWLGLLAGKQEPDATALAEIQSTGAGSGTYSATTDSQEAQRDLAGVYLVPLNGKIDALATPEEIASQVRTELDTELSRIDASISSRNSVAPDNDGIAAIQAVTDTLTLATPEEIASQVRTELDTELSRIDVSISSISGSGGQVGGPGAIPWTITVKRLNGVPISNAEIWITTDSAGSNVVAGTLYTDDFGKATFMLDPGSYYVWRDHPNYNFTNPKTIAVS